MNLVQNCKILIFFTFFELVFGQLKNGQCETDEWTTNGFEIEKFLGKWYELYRTAFKEQEDEICVELDFHNTDGKVQGTDFEKWPVNRYYLNATDGEAFNLTLQYKIRRNLDEGISNDGYYFAIFATNYKDWADVYACKNFGESQYKEAYWIYGRRKELEPEVLDEALSPFRFIFFEKNVRELKPIYTCF